jgi:hypothetical protein
MNSVILIPARYASTRYPGKPLVELKGAGGTAKPLIQRSVEAARRRCMHWLWRRRNHHLARMPQWDRALRRGAGAAP